MMHTEIAFANERAIIADLLINLLTNVRLTYLPSNPQTPMSCCSPGPMF